VALNLGNQFNNTYYIPLTAGVSTDAWDDHYANTLDNLLSRDPVPTENVKGEFGGLDNKKYAAYHQSKREQLAHTLTSRRLGKRPTGELKGYEDRPIPGDIKPRSPHPQGMLFDPHTATQTSKDPLYPATARDADIRSALQLHQKGTHISAHDKGVTGFKPEEESRLTEMLEHTNISKPELEYRTPKVRIGNTGTKSGFYSSHINEIRFDKSFATDKPVFFGEPTESLMHEWGHKVDNDVAISKNPAYTRRGYRERDVEVRASARTSKKYLISPIYEGVADGFRERHGTTIANAENAEALPERYLDPLQNKFSVDGMIGERREGIQRSPSMGYGVNNRYWKNRLEQALYAATRIHVGMHGRQGIESLPDIDSLADTHLGELANTIRDKNKNNSRKYADNPKSDLEYITTARHLYLGSLTNDQPAVAEGLKHLGFDDIAEHSKKVYDHFSVKKSKNTNQSALPGLESFADTNVPSLPKRLTSTQLQRTDRVAEKQREMKAQRIQSKIDPRYFDI